MPYQLAKPYNGLPIGTPIKLTGSAPGIAQIRLPGQTKEVFVPNAFLKRVDQQPAIEAAIRQHVATVKTPPMKGYETTQISIQCYCGKQRSTIQWGIKLSEQNSAIDQLIDSCTTCNP